MFTRLQSRHIWQGKLLAGTMLGLCIFQWTAIAGMESDLRMGQVAIGQNEDGRLEVFRVSSDGELQHCWQKEPSGEWSPWWGLGRETLFPGLAVARRVDGRLEVFAVEKTSRSLVCTRQMAPNAPGWSPWANLGGSIRSPAVVAQNLDGRLEIFAVEAERGGVKHLWQTGFQEEWSPWAKLGGDVESGLAVGRNKNGRLELFGVDAGTKALIHCGQTAPGLSNWSGWTSLGGTILPAPVVMQNADGHLEVFAVNRDSGAVDHIYQLVAGDGVQWSPWCSLGGDVEPGIAVGQNIDGRLEVFAVGRNETNIKHCWQAQENKSEQWSSFSGFQNMNVGGSVQPYPAVGRNQDGTLLIVARDMVNTNRFDYKCQLSAANIDWLDWFNMDQPPFPYTARTWRANDGLPHSVVQAIAQTPDGYLWVGTRGGLARFDGVNFFSFDAQNTPEIKNSSINALCVDHEGILWIGTDGGGAVCLKDGAFIHYGQRDGLGDVVKVIYDSRDGSIWFGTQTGLCRYMKKKFFTFSRRDGLLSDDIRCLWKDPDAHLWIGTSAGLNRTIGAVIGAFTITNGLPDNSIRGITQDKEGRLWIGSDKGMLWNKNWQGGFYTYDRKYGLSDVTVSAICDDRENNLWVGTYSGLYRFREGRFFSEKNNEGVPYDRINAIFEDRDGNVWVGSQEGLIRLTPKRFSVTREGLTHNNTVSVLEDRAGNMWVGTLGGGLNQIKEDGVTAYMASTNGLANNLVLSLCEGRDGSLWVSTGGGGLNRLQNGTFTSYARTNGLPHAAIKVIYEDRAGNLWLGTAEGLSCLKQGTFTNYTKKDNLAGNDIRVICEDSKGHLWFGTDGGLSRWENGQFSTFTTREGLSDNSVTALYADSEESLWIGTATGGLNRFNGKHFASCSSRQGLFSDEIFEILEDDHGWLWMSCSKGIYRVRKTDLDALGQGGKRVVTSIPYGLADGMESTLCNGLAKPAGWKTRDGKLWFPTTKGLVKADPDNFKINPAPPPVFIERLVVDNTPLMQGHNGLAGGYSDGSSIRVPPGRGELEFHFTVLTFQNPEKNFLKYRLEGVDSDWVRADSRRVAHYVNVYPGSYRFRVIGCNSDGVWNEVGASLAIVLLPHFWQTWWFYGLMGLVAVGGGGGTARYVVRRRMQRKLELLEQQRAIEHERTRIARDIHDDLGSCLTRIMMLGERVEGISAENCESQIHGRKIVAFSRKAVRSLDEIVWAVNPKNDTLDSLIGYLGQYADQFFEGTQVRCRRKTQGACLPIVISAEVRHGLFLVVKEALNNILKHAGASEVHLLVSTADSKIEIVIEDNGCGFDAAQTVTGQKRNGLENMHKRMDGINGQFLVSSHLEKGTQIIIRLPIKR